MRSRMSIGEDLAATDECKVYSCEHEEEDSEGDQIKEEKDFLAFCVYQYLKFFENSRFSVPSFYPNSFSSRIFNNGTSGSTFTNNSTTNHTFKPIVNDFQASSLTNSPLTINSSPSFSPHLSSNNLSPNNNLTANNLATNNLATNNLATNNLTANNIAANNLTANYSSLINPTNLLNAQYNSSRWFGSMINNNTINTNPINGNTINSNGNPIHNNAFNNNVNSNSINYNEINNNLSANKLQQPTTVLVNPTPTSSTSQQNVIGSSNSLKSSAYSISNLLSKNNGAITNSDNKLINRLDLTSDSNNNSTKANKEINQTSLIGSINKNSYKENHLNYYNEFHASAFTNRHCFSANSLAKSINALNPFNTHYSTFNNNHNYLDRLDNISHSLSSPPGNLNTSNSLSSSSNDESTIDDILSESMSKSMNSNTSSNHIKKPLNAFMIYMQENRRLVLTESARKESAAINQKLGEMWKKLPSNEQQIYFEKARKLRDEHKKSYPFWSAKDNYAINIRNKKKKRKEKTAQTHQFKEFTNSGGNKKKCRARFGVNEKNKWCKPCLRKKKCIQYQDNPATT